MAVGADITDPHAVQAMIDLIGSELAAPSILVANAAVSVAATGNWRDLSAADWRQVLNVNVVGAFNCVTAAWDGLAASQSGSVVVLSSVTALLGRTGNLAYVTSKAALIAIPFN